MYRLVDEKPVGVLNDWDLAVDAFEPGHAALERTGTVPYMALELLAAIYSGKAIPHIYGYDREAFIWVSIWLAVCYEHGTLREDHPLRAWQTGDYNTCSEKKSHFMMNWQDDNYLGSLPSAVDIGWRIASALLLDLVAGRSQRRDIRSSEVIPKKDDSDDARDSLWRRSWEVILREKVPPAIEEAARAHMERR